MSRKYFLFAVVFLIALAVAWPASFAHAVYQADIATPTITPTRWVALSAPNGGETLTAGDVYRITWQSSPNIDKVTLGYKSCPSCLDWIVTNIPNTGYYDWTVNVGNTTNTQFTIEIIGYQTGYGSTIDYSDAAFTVLQPSITSTPAFPTATPIPTRWVTVTTPNGGETLTVGDVYRITWQSSPNIDKVYIGYKSCPSCLDWIVTNIPNTGYYDWTVFVGNTINTQFTIEITGYETGYGSAVDASDAPFTVLQPPTATPTAIPTNTPTNTPIPQLSAPVLMYPINGAVISTVRPTFDWNDVIGATSYKIQVSASSDFSNPLVNASATRSTFTPSGKLPRGVVLYWRVQAYGKILPSNWSATTFKIK
jgi:hypothetical protein